MKKGKRRSYAVLWRHDWELLTSFLAIVRQVVFLFAWCSSFVIEVEVAACVCVCVYMYECLKHDEETSKTRARDTGRETQTEREKRTESLLYSLHATHKDRALISTVAGKTERVIACVCARRALLTLLSSLSLALCLSFSFSFLRSPLALVLSLSLSLSRSASHVALSPSLFSVCSFLFFVFSSEPSFSAFAASYHVALSFVQSWVEALALW